ncbi:FMC1-like protein [Lamellibrachia satsuma]|nr:FMC1-like protein [Lamellibrachia satsuma]
MAARVTGLEILKGLKRELRHVNKKGPLGENPTFAYVEKQFEKYRVTTRQICRGEEEVTHLGHTYLCLLESVRKHEELLKQYTGKGERSVEEAAELVGLRLPKLVTDEKESR